MGVKTPLQVLAQRVEILWKKDRGKAPFYRIPRLWLDPVSGEVGEVQVRPWEFFLSQLGLLQELPPRSWQSHGPVYQVFVRNWSAYDHDGDGQILRQNRWGFNEKGTFLKTLALLPYLYQLQVRTLHLLPVCAIGYDGRKGKDGSPYAVRHPYRLDATLAEPLLELPVELQFAALVEGAHALGMKVVLEFVLRTAAKDSVWAKAHPEWFYWISKEKASSFRSPEFSEKALSLIHQKVESGDFRQLPPPSQSYRRIFAAPPQRVCKRGRRWVGWGKRGKLVIPGAFADWPPDDSQPPWTDVTYLRLHTHPKFNYMAYNTLRMYDEELERPCWRNEDLWEELGQVIPFYQQNYHIDGVLLDMGHALPKALKERVVERVRERAPTFLFWDESFQPSEDLLELGYSGYVGNLWYILPRWGELKKYLVAKQEKETLLPFCTAETHNTPRAAAREGGEKFSRGALALCAFLPGIFYLHGGVELGETRPVNTGLDFPPGVRIPTTQLPLFTVLPLCWAEPRQRLLEAAFCLTAEREKWRKFLEKGSFHPVFCEKTVGLEWKLGKENLRVEVHLGLESTPESEDEIFSKRDLQAGEWKIQYKKR